MSLSVAVIGGGLGGLTAALSLLQAGFDVRVYEQARTLGEVGAGIQVSPNASRLLHGLGLAETLARTAVRPLAWHQRRWDDGRTLVRTPLGDRIEEVFGYPHYQVHRADLLALARRRAAARADGPAQRARDAQMAAGATDWSYGAVAWIYGHDAGAVGAVA